MRKKLIVANWKMNPKSEKEAKKLFDSIKKESKKFKNVEVGIAPPYIYLPSFAKKGMTLSSQNISAEKEGAFTGEVSSDMLKGFGVKYSIVGHSERRAMGETNDFINKKLKQAMRSGITPILCVGETERDGGMWYLGNVKTQIEEGLKSFTKNDLQKIVIAYEPVWAISTTKDRKDATPEDFEEMRIYICKVLVDVFGISPVKCPRILYGGSVDENNSGSFLQEGKADGLLIGKSSLNVKKFTKIISIANEIR